MSVQDGLTPEVRIDWSMAYKLLDDGAYEQVADLLFTRQMASEQSGDVVTAISLATVREVCLACERLQQDAEWHHGASDEAKQRIHELSERVQRIVELMRGQATHPRVEAESFVKPASDFHKGYASSWQWLKNLFDWRRRSVPMHPKISRLSAAEEPKAPRQFDVESPRNGSEEVAEMPIPQPHSLIDLSSPDRPNPLLISPPIDETPSHQVEALYQDGARSRSGAPHPVPTDSSAQQVDEVGVPHPPKLDIYCLGRFRVYQDDQNVDEWQSTKGLAVFKYLLSHREYPVAKEVLMELFWPESAPDSARNNLNVAIYGLRRALREGRPDFSHILYREDYYLLNPELRIWVDAEEFIYHVSVGQRLEQSAEIEKAMSEYRVAEALYQGEFLEDDRYEDWVMPQRQKLQEDYLNLLVRLGDYSFAQMEYDTCIVLFSKILAIDSCREDAHRNLMRCFYHQGHIHLAIRQYHTCVESLRDELDVGPSQETWLLYRQIHERQDL